MRELLRKVNEAMNKHSNIILNRQMIFRLASAAAAAAVSFAVEASRPDGR